MAEDLYDIIIIGAGPAGATAALYSARARLKTLVIESYMNVSQISITDKIENYPGFPEGIKGPELIENMKKQAKNFGAEFGSANVKSITQNLFDNKKIWEIETDIKNYKTLAVIIASGAKPRELSIPGEDKFKGRGVSYCAVCDAPFFKEKQVIVVGGGDTAVEEALYLTKFAQKVKLVHRRDRLRATKILQERAFANEKIETIWNSVVTEIIGETKVKSVKIKNIQTEEEKTIECDGVFIFIGLAPNTDFVKDVLKTDDNGYIIVDTQMKTSAEGIFAAGDCIQKRLRQVITAAGDGATAAHSARLYVEKLKGMAYE